MSRPRHLVLDVVAQALLADTGMTPADIADRLETRDMDCGWMKLVARGTSSPLAFDVVPTARGPVLANAWRTIGRICAFTSGWMVNTAMDSAPFIQVDDCILPPSTLDAAVGRPIGRLVELPDALTPLDALAVTRVHQEPSSPGRRSCVQFHLPCGFAVLPLET